MANLFNQGYTRLSLIIVLLSSMSSLAREGGGVKQLNSNSATATTLKFPNGPTSTIKFSSVIPKDEEEPESGENYEGNVPFSMCGSEEDGPYAELLLTWMDPPCEEAPRGYCRIRRNQNYTTKVHYIPRVPTKAISVHVTSLQPVTGWENSFWPEYGACARFNITCPQTPDVKIYAHNEDKVPNEVPPTRRVIRLRMLGIGEDDVKRTYFCRQISLQFY